MVDRTSQDAQFNSGPGVQAQQSNSGAAPIDFAKYSTTSDLSAASQPTSASSRVLDGILAVAGKLTDTMYQQGKEEAYLDGVAKAGTLKSEQELDANPIMKNWQTAGYRDTMGRIASADNEAQIATDMHKMREVSPQEFNDYIATKRKDLLPSLEGMSATARKTMFAQLMLNERAAIQKHASEHYKFGVETETAAVKAQLDTSLSNLQKAKSNEATYGTATDATFMAVSSSIALNEKIPREMRGKLIGEVLENALQNNHLDLYNKILNTNMTQADGTVKPMSSLMSWDESKSAMQAYQSALTRTLGIRSAKYGEDIAKLQADFHNPDAPMPSIDAMRAKLDEGQEKFPEYMTAQLREKIMYEYNVAGAKKVGELGLANSFQNGDVQGVFGKNKTMGEGRDAWWKVYGSKMPLPEASIALARIGIEKGIPEAFQKMGEIQKPAWGQVMTQDSLDPNNAGLIQSTFKVLESAEQRGNKGVFQQYLTQFDPGTQSFILNMRDGMQQSGDPSIALGRARKIALDTAALSPEMKVALYGQATKENAAAVADLDAKGMLGTLWLKTKAVVSTDAANLNKLTAYESYWENPQRVAEAGAATKLEVIHALDTVTRQNPLMSASARMTLATSLVAGRTVVTPDGPLTVPEGKTVQEYFGVGKSVGQERIASALMEYIKPQAGNRLAFQVGADGQLMYQERNSKGELTRPYQIDPKVIKSVVDKQDAREAEDYKIYHGEGTTLHTKDGDKTLSINFNGDNTVGVDNKWMHSLRTRLVQHEGNTDVPKPDVGGAINKRTGKPVMTVGPGLSDTNDFYPKPGPDGKITQQQKDTAFRDASNAAAQAGVIWMGSSNTGGKEPAFQLFTELAYQGGNYNGSIPPLLKAIKNRDMPAAKAALENTKAWQMAGDSARRKFYNQALIDTMKD